VAGGIAYRPSDWMELSGSIDLKKTPLSRDVDVSTNDPLPSLLYPFPVTCFKALLSIMLLQP